MTGKIRLSCLHCDTEECDGVDAIPADWLEMDQYQSYEQSVEEVPIHDLTRSVAEWYTHLGVCPECARIHGYLKQETSA